MIAIVDWELLVAFVMVFLSFAFSASETALTSLGRLEAQSIIRLGGARSTLIQYWLRNPSRVLVTVLIGNNIANIAASSLVTYWASHQFSDSGVPVAIGVFTFIFIIAAEIIPKLLAKHKAIPLAPVAMRFLKAVAIVLYPLSGVIQILTRGIIRMIGLPSSDFRAPLSEQEVEHTIELATREGGLDKETGVALSNLMDFSDLKARDVMTARSKIKAVSISWTLSECIEYIIEDGHSRYPVYSQSLDDIAGFLLVKDLLGCVHKQNTHWSRVVRRPYYVSELESLGDILKDMKRVGTHLALVRNETGVVTGLVTFEDLIEEIVGEVRDETDDPGEAGYEGAMGAPRVISGEIPIVDFNQIYKTSLDLHESYSTLNGYLLARSGGNLPDVGTMIIGDDLTFRIHSISDTGVATVEIIN
ncbi:HlyC/CorC family transporter [bacterium]|nr:HlyC/CorC family transporter [bacterium]